MKITYIPDLLITTENGRIPTEAWVIGQLNHDTLFVVTRVMPASKHYIITHVPSGRAMVGQYSYRAKALKACRETNALLKDDETWNDWRLTPVLVKEWASRAPEYDVLKAIWRKYGAR